MDFAQRPGGITIIPNPDLILLSGIWEFPKLRGHFLGIRTQYMGLRKIGAPDLWKPSYSQQQLELRVVSVELALSCPETDTEHRGRGARVCVMRIRRVDVVARMELSTLLQSLYGRGDGPLIRLLSLYLCTGPSMCFHNDLGESMKRLLKKCGTSSYLAAEIPKPQIYIHRRRAKTTQLPPKNPALPANKETMRPFP